MPESFRYYFRVRYGECDAQKVVFNARYGDYVDIAITEYLRALGHGAALACGALDFQLVRQTTEWRASARYDDVLEATVETQRIGTTSFTLRCDFRVAGHAPLVCSAETVYVLIDPATMRKREIDPALRATLSAGAPDRQVDHAGHLLRPD